MLRAKSQSSPYFRGAFQPNGTQSIPDCIIYLNDSEEVVHNLNRTLHGMCIAIGDTDSSVNILSSGDASIKFNSWCSQQLNVLLAYLKRMYYLKIGALACAGAQGRTGLWRGFRRLFLFWVSNRLLSRHPYPQDDALGDGLYPHQFGLIWTREVHAQQHKIYAYVIRYMDIECCQQPMLTVY